MMSGMLQHRIESVFSPISHSKRATPTDVKGVIFSESPDPRMGQGLDQNVVALESIELRNLCVNLCVMGI